MAFQCSAGRKSKTGSTTARRGERRGEVRYKVSIPANVRIPLEDRGSSILLVAKATIENLSTKGAYIHLHKIKRQHAGLLMSQRRRFSLVFSVPGSDVPLLVAGEVVWTDFRADTDPCHAYMGLELNRTAPGERERLREFLATLAK